MKITLRHTLIALTAPLMLASCSTDDISTGDSTLWKGTLADAPYAADAALYEINDVNGDTDITSIELTGSGLYFISYAPQYGEDQPDYPDYPYYDEEDYYLSAFRSRSAGRASDYEQDIVTGTFTRIPSGGWHLDGFGDIIYRDGYIDVTLDSGEKMQWPATVAPHVEPNVLNNRLCRTWRFTDATIEFLDRNNKIVLTHELTDAEISETYVDYFTFTRSGRLYEYDHDGECDRLNWTWANSRSQIIMLSADNYMDGSGMIQVFFDNNDIRILVPEEYGSNEELLWEYGDIIPGIPASAIYTRTYFTCTNHITK